MYAKNLQIPYIICDSLDFQELKDKKFDCILDCNQERLYLSPNKEIIESYKKILKSSQKEFLDENIVRTKNNRFIRVCSNISSVEEYVMELMDVDYLGLNFCI